MKRTFLFIHVFLCSLHISASDAELSAPSPELLPMASKRVSKALTDFEQSCLLLRSDDPKKRITGFWSLKENLHRVRVIQSLAPNELRYEGIMPFGLDYDHIEKGNFVFVESEDECIQLCDRRFVR